MRAVGPLELAAVTLATAVAMSGSASAQGAAPPAPSRFELSPGFVWMGGNEIGSRDATESTATGGSFGLFSTSTRLDGGTGFEGRIGVRITRSIQVEAGASHIPTRVTTTISADAEGGAGVNASESVDQLMLEGGVVVNLTRWRIGGRTYPILTAGAGYLRQVHEGATVAESGSIYEFGGGARTILVARPRAFLTAVGVRTEARLVARSGGVALDGGTHLSPAFSASVFFGF